MPSYKSKKTLEKQQSRPSDLPVIKPLSKIKFNISMDNLRPFVEGRTPIHSTRKKQQSSEINHEKPKKTIKTEESKPQIYSYSQQLRRQGKSPDVSRQVANEIIQKIEANGIKFAWKDVEQVRSQCCEQQEWAYKQVWSDFSPRYQFQKNHSHASTNDHYSAYYPQGYQYMIDYNYAQKSRQYDLNYFIIDVGNIEDDARTTLMIKNIPNKYTIQFLSEEIDKQHSTSYDFLYLPCDIKNNCNVGYGFINFLSTKHLKSFYYKFHNKRWGKFKSEKICNLTYARLQGLNSLIEHFQNSKVLNNKDKKYQPIIKEFSKIDHLIKEQKQKSNNPL